MQALDTTIATFALPYMQGSVSASFKDQIDWVLTSYIVAAAIMTPPTGFLAGRFGIKRLFLVSVAGFTFASMLCGIAQSLVQIVLFRILQGLFGAALVPLSQTVLLDINAKERQGSAMALWGMAVMAGPVLGAVLGGWLTEVYSWRYVFYINLPIGVLAFLGMTTFLKETPRNATTNLDWFGFGTLSLAIGAMQVVLDRGEEKNWFGSGEIIIETVIAASALYLFLVHTFTAREPFVRPSLFRDRNLGAGTLFVAIVGLTYYAWRCSLLSSGAHELPDRHGGPRAGVSAWHDGRHDGRGQTCRTGRHAHALGVGLGLTAWAFYARPAGHRMFRR